DVAPVRVVRFGEHADCLAFSTTDAEDEVVALVAHPGRCREHLGLGGFGRTSAATKHQGNSCTGQAGGFGDGRLAEAFGFYHVSRGSGLRLEDSEAELG